MPPPPPATAARQNAAAPCIPASGWPSCAGERHEKRNGEKQQGKSVSRRTAAKRHKNAAYGANRGSNTKNVNDPRRGERRVRRDHRHLGLLPVLSPPFENHIQHRNEYQ